MDRYILVTVGRQPTVLWLVALLRAGPFAGRAREFGTHEGQRRRAAPMRHLRTGTPDRLDEAVLLSVLADVKDGDFSVRMPLGWTGLAGKIADTLNDVIAANQALGAELAR